MSSLPPPPDGSDYALRFRVSDLKARTATAFDMQLSGAQLARLAADVGADKLRKLRFRGELRPLGQRDWILQARLGATVVQPCVVSLAPVVTRIDEDVRRTYLADMPVVHDPEAEIPEDDSIEPLGPVIDAGAVLAEALALAMPLYPRAPGVELGDVTVSEPGAARLQSAEIKPFAGLAALREKLGNGQEND